MKLTHLAIVAVAATLSVATTSARAADWFKLGEAQFSARLPITINNPADTDNPAVFVSVDLLDLGAIMPEGTAKTVAVADDHQEIVPFQVSKIQREHLQFVVPVKAHETKTLYIYAAEKPIQAPRFEAKTSTDIRQAYRSFENEFQAFRMEVGKGANTTGMAIDLFGKTKQGRGVQLKNIYASQYHQRQPWGIDIMKVGTGPGLGGAYVVIGDKLGRADRYTTDFKVVYEGPVVSEVQASGPVEIDGKKFKVTRTVHCLAGDRALLDHVEVQGDNPDALNDVEIGLGLRDLPNQHWSEKQDKGYCLVAGDGNQAGTNKLGLGVAFDPKSFVKMREIEDKDNGGHIYVLKPQKDAASARITDRLMAYWDGDGWINNAGDFETLCAQYGRLITSPAKIQLAKEAEKR